MRTSQKHFNFSFFIDTYIARSAEACLVNKVRHHRLKALPHASSFCVKKEVNWN